MKTLDKTQEQLQDMLQLKFNEMFFKSATIMKKHSVRYDGLLYSATEIHLIDTIGRKPEANVTQLATYQGVTKSAISQKLKVLEDGGFITRRRLPDNGKEVIVELTTLGWDVYRLHDEYHRVEDKEIFEFLSKASLENIQFLIDGFEIMNRVMDRHLDKKNTVMDLDREGPYKP